MGGAAPPAPDSSAALSRKDRLSDSGAQTCVENAGRCCVDGTAHASGCAVVHPSPLTELHSRRLCGREHSEAGGVTKMRVWQLRVEVFDT